MQIGIAGLPGAARPRCSMRWRTSTLRSAATPGPSRTWPWSRCPDERLDKLSALFQPHEAHARRSPLHRRRRRGQGHGPGERGRGAGPPADRRRAAAGHRRVSDRSATPPRTSRSSTSSCSWPTSARSKSGSIGSKRSCAWAARARLRSARSRSASWPSWRRLKPVLEAEQAGSVSRAVRGRAEGDLELRFSDPEADAGRAQSGRRAGPDASCSGPGARARSHDVPLTAVLALPGKLEMELGELSPEEAAEFMAGHERRQAASWAK